MPYGDSQRRRKALAAHLRKRPPKEAPNVVPIRPREEYGVVQTADSLKVRFASRPGEPPQELDLSEWLHRGELGLAVAHYLADWGAGRSHATRHGQQKLVGYFLAYLRASEASGFKPITSISQLSTELIAMYVAWLDGAVELIRSKSKPLGKNTKSLRYNAVKQMLSFWQRSKRYRSVFPADIRLQRNPWPGRHHQTKATKILDPISRSRIRQAAIAEIIADRQMREATFAALADETLELPDPKMRSVVPFKDMRVKLKLVAETFGCQLPPREELEAYPGLCRAMKRPYGTVREVAERLHFSPRALVPYVVLIDLETTFNGEGMLGLSWSEVKDHPIFGSERWQIAVPKNRATKGDGEEGTAFHRRSFAANLTAVDSPVNLLKALKRFTELTRPLVPERHRDRVFIFYVAGPNGYRSFEGHTGTASEDGSWNRELKAFIADNKLPDFTLRTLRATGGDVVHEVTGDMKAQQVAMGHAGLGMTIKHYRSGAAKQRDEEALSHGLAWRERFIETNGKADTRNGSLMPGGQKAVTPGFGCVDPFNPPFDRHPAGKLCAAFGGCAACSLALIDPDDPRAYARLIQFRDRLIEARTSVDPMRYLEVWAPQLARLEEYWLPKFTESGRAGASLVLPPFPELE